MPLALLRILIPRILVHGGEVNFPVWLFWSKKKMLHVQGSLDLGVVGVGFNKFFGLGLLNECSYNGIIIHERSFYFCSHESAFSFM